MAKAKDKIKVLFVCHGNICRSPMAEFLFKKMVADKGTAARFEIASAATSREEIGNGVYPPAKALLKRLGIDTTGKTARQITKQDLDYYDFVIVMDNNNLRNLSFIFPAVWAVILPILGIPTILRPPTRISWKA